MFLKTTPSYKMKCKVFTGTMLRTLHSFVSYYLQSEMTEHMNFVVTAECLKNMHCSCTFVSQHIMQLPSKLKDFNEVYYFSDGAALWYKRRKNFINLYCHIYGYDMDTVWHFSTMSHGRGVWLLVIASGVGLSPLYCAHFWPIVPEGCDGTGDKLKS
jgi:hypothetical protein